MKIEPSLETSQLVFENLPETWVLGLLVLPGILLLSWWIYQKPKSSAGPWMLTLRALLLSLVVFFALDPVLRKSEQIEEPANLVLLIDDSASISRSDTNTTGNKQTRANHIQSFLHGPVANELKQQYKLDAWKFSSRLSPTELDGSLLSAQGDSTALGSSLLDLAAEYRGRTLPKIVLLTDGRQNQGVELEQAASHYAAEGASIHCLALGDPRPLPDLGLERVQAPDVVLAGDDALFVMRLRGSGNQLPPQAVVELRDSTERILDRASIAPSKGLGTRFSLGTILSEPGIHQLHAVVPALKNETALENNRLEFSVEVQPLKIRVLYVEGRPRFEYRYLKNRLIRSDQDIQTRCWLAEAGRDFQQESSPGLPALRRVPTTSEELLNDFDVIILGDIDPQGISPDPLDGARFLSAVREFVESGGGLLMLAGERHNPNSFRGTVLEELLPVFLDQRTPRVEEFHPLPADPEMPHPITRVEGTPKDSMAFWEMASPLWWWQPVGGLKPGAQAWLINPNATNPNGDEEIIAAGIYVPKGRVGWLGTDESWRWRDPSVERHLARLWRSILRHLATGRLQGDHGRARLELDRSRVELGESVLIEARLLDEDWEVMEDLSGLNIFHETRDLPPLRLHAVAGEAGLFRGQYRPLDIGDFSFILTSDFKADGEVLDSAAISVHIPAIEMRDTSQDRDSLANLASKTGGIYLTIDEAEKLLKVLDGKDKVVRTLSSNDTALANGYSLTLFLLLAIGEWLLRKRSNLA